MFVVMKKLRPFEPNDDAIDPKVALIIDGYEQPDPDEPHEMFARYIADNFPEYARHCDLHWENIMLDENDNIIINDPF